MSAVKSHHFSGTPFLPETQAPGKTSEHAVPIPTKLQPLSRLWCDLIPSLAL